MGLASACALLTGCSGTGLRVGAPETATPAPPLQAASAAAQAAVTPSSPPAAGDTAIAPPPASFSGPAPRRRPAPPTLTSAGPAPGPGVWAVVVGVNDYPGVAHDLRSAVHDANDVDAALAGFGVPGDHRLVLRDGQVTRSVLQAALRWLVRQATPDATAVFVFAGHVRKTGRTTEAMVMADGSLMSDAELARELAALRAQRAWIVMAACYGGGFTEALRPGRVLTAAAGPDEIAYENLTFGRSYLVQFMVRQGFIEGRATNSVQAAFAYARETIAKDYPDRVPVEFDQAGGPLDLRQQGAVPASSPPSTAPPPPPPPDRAEQQEPATEPADSPPPGGGSTTTTTTTQPPPCRKLLVVGC